MKLLINQIINIMKTINVSSNSTGITLTSGGNVDTPKNGKVQWTIGSKIERILITPSLKTGDISIWSTTPGKLGQSENWQGTVGDTAGHEYYSVGWWKKDGTHGSVDPKITVNN